MPTNNFKLFDENKANLLTDTEYGNSTQRLNGVQTGVASSQLNNKFAYQVSLVAYAIAQIMNQNGLDASDTLSVSAFVGNLGSALLQKVADRASTTEAVAGVLNNKYITPATMKAAALLLSGGTMTGGIDMNGNSIINLQDPVEGGDAANKEYVDSLQVFRNRDLYSAYYDSSSSTPYINLSNQLDYSHVSQLGLSGLYIELSNIQYTFVSSGIVYMGISTTTSFSYRNDYYVNCNLQFDSSNSDFPFFRQWIPLNISIKATDNDYGLRNNTGLNQRMSDTFYLFLSPKVNTEVIKCSVHIWAF